MQGWIKLHRKFVEWEWFRRSEMVHTMLYFILMANHAPNKWQGFTIETGQFVTSFDKISKATGLTIQTIRTCINRLKSTGEITTKTTNKYTVVTICKYDNYQDTNPIEQQTEQQAEQQTSNKQVTTNKNDKNKETNISVIFEAFRKSFPGTKRGLETELKNFLKKNTSEVVHLLLPALEKEKQNRANLEEQKKTDSKIFIPTWKNLSTWINQNCWEQEFSEIKPNKQVNGKIVAGQSTTASCIDSEILKRANAQQSKPAKQYEAQN